jgi:hypothetical protein
MKTWSLSWSGLRTVVALELHQRTRSKRWLAALITWFFLIGAVVGLVLWAVWESTQYNDFWFRAGPLAFGLITLFVL